MEKDEYQRLYELEDQLWWFVGMREISLNLLDRFLPEPRPLAILDAGCGTGGMLPHLASYGEVWGVDLSPEALRFAGLRAPQHLARASLLGLPFPSQTFDLVTSFDVIYHRAVPDDELALTEIARVLRPRGTLLIRVPAHDRLRSSHDEAVHTRQRYGRGELRAKLAGAGLDTTYMTYANCLLFPVVVLKRLLGNKLRGHQRESDVQQLAAPVNRTLTSLIRFEARVVKSGRLPFGLSLIAVARRA